jgi:hypothetical protein
MPFGSPLLWPALATQLYLNRSAMASLIVELVERGLVSERIRINGLPQLWGHHLRNRPNVWEAVFHEFDSWAMPAPSAVSGLAAATRGVDTLRLGKTEPAPAPTTHDPTTVPFAGASVWVISRSLPCGHRASNDNHSRHHRQGGEPAGQRTA